MFIHHYTRACTLPLILETQRIRFRRADLLDDSTEMPFKTAHLDPRNYFVSSWSMVDREQSGQWYRYGDMDRGVRITLPATPFAFRYVILEISRIASIPSMSSSKVGIKLENVAIPFTTTEMLGKGYVLTPFCPDMPAEFGGPVEYVSCPAMRAADFFTSDDQKTTVHNVGKLGRIKSEAWSDQAEYRFVLMAQEGPSLDRSQSPEAYDSALLDLFEESIASGTIYRPASVAFIDLPLAPGILNKMTVTLGANISREDRDAIEKAVHLYAPKARIVESSMRIRAPSE